MFQVPEWTDREEHARWTAVCAMKHLQEALNLLIPVPDVRTHNVAIALDELIREAEAAFAEMP
jgi:hypothetical protein